MTNNEKLNSYILALHGETAQLQFGEKLAGLLQPGMRLFLLGQIGAGKTTFVRGLLYGLGVTGVVKSPTYTLVESYDLPTPLKIAGLLRVHHFDFYRLKDPEELTYLGVEDFLADQALCVIEWPECAQALLPPPTLTIAMSVLPEARVLTITGDADLIARIQSDANK